ncbi:hypothetical protein GE061_004674 [Apolygus lucorum]|nr:hypothetical protein GE061_004674 [Apolygus lucorum]
MSRERALERETERAMARRREVERERQDREFQRMRGGGESAEGSPRDARRRPGGDEDETLNNQRPWQYVRPTDLNLKPKYDRTMKPRFAPEVPPKPAIPQPDYSGSPAAGRNRWDPTNLSRANSNAAYPERWNPRRAY